EYQKVLESKGSLSSIKEVIKAIEEEGFLSKEELEKALSEKMTSHLYDLFLQTDSTYEFHKDIDILPSPKTVTLHFFQTNAFLEDLASKMEEWKDIQKAIPSTKVIFLPTPKFEEALQYIPLPRNVREEAVLINGERNVEEIIESSPVSTFEILQLLAELVKEGGIRPISGEEALEKYQQAQEKGEREESLKYIQTLQDGESLSLEKKLLLVKALEESRNKAQAQELYFQIMQQASQEGKWDIAIEMGEKLLPFKKGEPKFLEILFNLYFHANHEKTKEFGMDVGYLLFQDGKRDLAWNILEKVYQKYPHDLEVNEMIAEVGSALGFKEIAIKACQILMKSDLPEEKKQKILQIYMPLDPSRGFESGVIENIPGKEDEIDTSDIFTDSLVDSASFPSEAPQIIVSPKSQKRSSTKYVVIMGIIFFFIFLLFGIYELRGRTRFAKIQNQWEKKSKILLANVNQEISRKKPDLQKIQKWEKEYKKIVHAFKDLAEQYKWTWIAKKVKYAYRKHQNNFKYIHQMVETIQKRISNEKESRYSSFLSLLNYNLGLEKKGKLQEAIQGYFRISRQFPEWKKKITLPLDIETSPTGALVTLNGASIGKTPIKKRIPIPQKKEWE
ncbi:MAG: PEGA domain-containing protein, partial [Planctomycetota bacterium]